MSGINLFIAAAGYGSRLAPLTDEIPKPLIKVNNIPAIDYVLMHAYSSFVLNKIVINTHHLAEQIRRWANKSLLSSQIHLLYESQILGTGGALANAKSVLQSGTTLVLNSDVISDMDLVSMYEYHQVNQNDITLAIDSNARHKTVGLDVNGCLVCVGLDNDVDKQVDRWVGFACAALYQPKFISLLPDGNSHVVSAWLKAKQLNFKIGTWDIGNCYWCDIGTLQDLETANIYLKKHRIDFYPNDRFLKNRKPKFLGSGGGNRCYYRCQDSLLSSSPLDDEDIYFQVEHTEFFLAAGLNVPKIYEVDFPTKRLLLQDLGDITLQQAPTLSNYKKTLDQLFILHSLNPKDCFKLNSRCLDYAMLQWESSYFKKYHLETSLDDINLQKEFDYLASEVSKIPTGIIHRDCQSQNVMLFDNQAWFIDFQGARRGAVLYDLASLLRDPYVDISDMYLELVDYYYFKLKQVKHTAMNNFKRNLRFCGIQRHLQALGAYGFLSTVKGKPQYLKYIKPALNYLLNELGDDFPAIKQALLIKNNNQFI